MPKYNKHSEKSENNINTIFYWFVNALKRTIDILASIFAILYYHVYLYWLSLHHEDQLYINQFDTLIKANILICISLD